MSIEAIAAGQGLRRRDMTPQERRDHDNHMQKRRQAAYRRRRDTTQATPPDEPSLARRVAVSTLVVAPLTRLIDDIASMQAAKWTRRLGGIHEDIGIDTWDRVVRHVSKSKWEMSDLIAASDALAVTPNLDIRISDHEGSTGVAAKWLLGVITNSAKQALETRYRAAPTLMSVEKMVTLANDYDPMDSLRERFKEDRSVSLVGWNAPPADAPDLTLANVAITAAITERKLDPVTEVLLNDEYRRSDGMFRWSEFSDRVWKALGLPMGPFRKLPKDKRAQAAKTAVRNRFSWMPEAYAKAVAAFAPECRTTLRPSFQMTQAVQSEDRAKVIATAILDLLRDVPA